VRRAAGEARDWDVFLIALEEKRRAAAVTHRPGLDFLFGYALAQRAAAQSHLDATGTDYPYVLEQLQTDLAASIQTPNGHHGKTTLGKWAPPMLSDLLAALETQAAGNLADYACLHQVRIAGKKLRYAMEVFADCFAPKFREEIYPAVEAMQDILGAANDSQVASVRLSALRESLQKSWPAEWKQFRPGIEGLLRYHQSRLTRERKRFQGWWKRWETTGMERTLETLIQ
jgi:CHAD domain-containing protein